MICSNLENLGIVLDEQLNAQAVRGKAMRISKERTARSRSTSSPPTRNSSWRGIRCASSRTSSDSGKKPPARPRGFHQAKGANDMSGNTFIQDIRAKAAKKHLRVAFPDAEDVRTIQAALTSGSRKNRRAGPRRKGRSHPQDRRGQRPHDRRDRDRRSPDFRIEGSPRPNPLRETESQGHDPGPPRPPKPPSIPSITPVSCWRPTRWARWSEETLLDRRRHPCGHPHGRNGARHLHGFELFRHGPSG